MEGQSDGWAAGLEAESERTPASEKVKFTESVATVTDSEFNCLSGVLTEAAFWNRTLIQCQHSAQSHRHLPTGVAHE